jgi:hypothetical protein
MSLQRQKSYLCRLKNPIRNDDILLRQLVFPDEVPETAQTAADGAVYHQSVQLVVLALQRV